MVAVEVCGAVLWIRARPPCLQKQHEIGCIDHAVAIEVAGDDADGAVFEGEVRAELIPFHVATEGLISTNEFTALIVIAAG